MYKSSVISKLSECLRQVIGLHFFLLDCYFVMYLSVTIFYLLTNSNRSILICYEMLQKENNLRVMTKQTRYTYQLK